MEDAESDSIGNEQYAQIPKDWPEVTCYLGSSAEEVVCEIATEDNNKVIYQQNAPIRKCAASEVPIDESRKDIHSFYLSILAKIAFSPQSHKEKRSKKAVEVYFCNVLITKE